jgi:hypothetical protein
MIRWLLLFYEVPSNLLNLIFKFPPANQGENLSY